MEDFETKVAAAKHGDEIIYYTGETPLGEKNIPPNFRKAALLHNMGVVSLVQRLVSRKKARKTRLGVWRMGLGTYDYIAQRI